MKKKLLFLATLIPFLLITSTLAYALTPIFPKGTQNLPGWPWGKALGTLDAYNDFNNGTNYRGHCEDHGINGKTLSAGYCQGFNYGYDFEWHAVLGGEVP